MLSISGCCFGVL